MGTHNGNKKLSKKGKQNGGFTHGVTVLVGYSVTVAGVRNEETWSTQNERLFNLQHGPQETQEQQGRHSITDKH